MDDLTGKILGGRYRVDTFLGHGGMASVYKVWDQQRAAFLAMKVLHSELAEDLVFLRRFKREALMLERLQHPNIVRFYGLEEADGLAFILMDFIEGLTLRKEIFLSKGGMRPARILQILQPVCSALHYAHQMGLVHCDIKPANIMVHRNGVVYLTDFGIARMNETRTQTMTGAGTPAYMAPEQSHGQEPSPLTDIYALGVVLFEMLTGGERPFTGESGQATGTTSQRIIWEKRNLLPSSPTQYNPRISPELEAVTIRCLAADPALRFTSVLSLLHALEFAVRGQNSDLEVQTLTGLTNLPAQVIHDSAQPSGAEHPPVTGSVPDTPYEPVDDAPSKAVLPVEHIRRFVPWVATGLTALLLFILVITDQQAARPVPAVQAAGTSSVTSTSPAPAPTGTRTAQMIVPTVQVETSPTPVAPTQTPLPLPTVLGGSPGKIAFASDRSGTVQLWVMDAGAPENRRQVTYVQGGACQPSWSPDGARLAFTTPCNGPRLTYPGAKIKVIELESGEITDLKIPGGAFDPAWSPDGQAIAYTTFNGEETEVHAVDLTTMQRSVLSSRGRMSAHPAWSPDGAFLAFTSDDHGVHEVWLMRKDGGSQEVLTQAGILKYFSRPRWSPDGTMILASMKELNATSPQPVQVLLERETGQEIGALTDEELIMENGSFSPDGRWVVFGTLIDGANLEVMRVSLQGRVERLTNSDARDFHPACAAPAP